MPVFNAADLQVLKDIIQRNTMFVDDLDECKRELAEQNKLLESIRQAVAKRTHATTPGVFRQAVTRPAIKTGDCKLSGGQLEIMKAVAQYPDGIGTETIAVLTGYKSTSRYEYLRQLKAKGLIEEDGGMFRPTDQGIADLGSGFEPLPTGEALREHWSTRLTGGEQKIFAVLVEQYPAGMTKEEIMRVTGFKSTSIYEFTRQLKARQLVEVDRGTAWASQKLFEK